MKNKKDEKNFKSNLKSDLKSDLKSIEELMNQMGFRKEAPDSAKEAFLKNLIQQSLGVDIETPTEKHRKNLSKYSKIKAG